MWQARSHLVQAFQQAAASSNVNRGGPIGRSPDMQRPRGAPDERAAQAANEVRKKAAARGLNVRPQAAAPNQSIPPLGDLLSLINSGVAREKPLLQAALQVQVLHEGHQRLL
jgi:protein TIF31